MSINKINPEKVLIFDIRGPMAHFRKYYTNSSSLSYLFPPRTVIVGLIAGLLGLASERHTKNKEETYYEKFSTDKCFVAVSMRTKVRRIMQSVNYIKTKTDKYNKYSFEALVTGTRGPPTQIPLEILLPENSCDELTYRIYFYHVELNDKYDELKKRLEGQRFVYPPYLGLTEFLASIDYIDEGTVSRNQNIMVELNSICKLREVELDFDDNNLQYNTEKMPTGFLSDRTPLPPEEYVMEVKGDVMKVKLKEDASCFSVKYSEREHDCVENIMFM